MAKLTPEELDSIKSLQSKYNQTIFEIGASEAQLIAFQQGISKLQKTKEGLVSDVLNFYTNAKGEVVAEIMAARWFDSKLTDEELMDYFNNTDEVIDYVMRLDSDEDLYNRVISAPPLASGIPRDYMILNNFLNWFDAVVYNKIDMREE